MRALAGRRDRHRAAGDRRIIARRMRPRRILMVMGNEQAGITDAIAGAARISCAGIPHGGSAPTASISPLHGRDAFMALPNRKRRGGGLSVLERHRRRHLQAWACGMTRSFGELFFDESHASRRSSMAI